MWFKIVSMFFIITIPLFLGAVVWQSHRFDAVDKEVTQLEENQERWVNATKRLIADGAKFMSTGRIEEAIKVMNLEKIPPERIWQINVYEGK